MPHNDARSRLCFFSAILARNKDKRLIFESLEIRSMLSANTLAVEFPTDAAAGVPDLVAQTEVTPLLSSITTPVGYTPAKIAAAYGFSNINLGGVAGNGAGQTIAIVDAYDDPNIASDLAKFDSQFGLPVANFTKIEQYVGGQAPVVDGNWATEISLDVEWAHAMAPGAKIELVEANTPTLANFLMSVQYAASIPGVSVVSMSWGTNDFSGEANYNSYFTTPAGHTGVSFVASTGDNGSGALWPAISTNVLSVGGTTLILSGSSYYSESAWSGSGGGKSSYQPEASYQLGVQSSGAAEDPDVSYDGNPSTGFAVYDSVPYENYVGWEEVGGTSAGAPQWAALVAIADQGRVRAGENTLTNAAAAVYSLPSSDFHDIIGGSNGSSSATRGYDEVTGLGSPQANSVVQGLLGITAVQQTYSTTTYSTAPQFGLVSAARNSSQQFSDVDGSSPSSLLIAGVSFSQAAAGSNVTGANTNVSGSTASVNSRLASPLVTINQAYSMSRPASDNTTGELATHEYSEARINAVLDVAEAGRESQIRFTENAGVALTAAPKSDLATASRSRVGRLDSLFASAADWTDGHFIAVADSIVAANQNDSLQRQAVTADSQPTSGLMLAAALALSAIWPERLRSTPLDSERPSLAKLNQS
jgi:subtilase family serine protease